MTETTPETTVGAMDSEHVDSEHTDDTANADEQTGADGDERADGDQGTDDEQADGENPRAEIRYRRQLRAVQADLASVTARLEQQQQSIVDTIATARGVDPRLLRAAGHTLESLSDERGVIDQAAVLDAVAAVVREFRIAQPVKPNPQQGKPSASFGGATWAEALRGY